MRLNEVQQRPGKNHNQCGGEGEGELGEYRAQETLGPTDGAGDQRQRAKEEVEAVQREGTAVRLRADFGARWALRKPKNITNTPTAWPT